MMRIIVRSAKNEITLQLPDDLIGKTVEVIAFEVEDAVPAHGDKLKPSQLRGFLSAETAQKMQEHIQKGRNEWNS